MKLYEIAKKEKKPGSYIGWYLDDKSKEKIKQYMKDAKIEYPSKPSNLHITVLYSEKHCPNLVPIGKFNTPIPLNIEGLDLFGSDKDDKVLVVRLSSKKITKRNKELTDKYNVVSEYGEYKPHISIGYKLPDNFDISSLPNIKNLGRLFACEEYYNDLENNWVEDNMPKKKGYK